MKKTHPFQVLYQRFIVMLLYHEGYGRCSVPFHEISGVATLSECESDERTHPVVVVLWVSKEVECVRTAYK